MARFSKLFIFIPENSSIRDGDFCTFVLMSRWKARRIALFIEFFSPERKTTTIKSNILGVIGLPEPLCKSWVVVLFLSDVHYCIWLLYNGCDIHLKKIIWKKRFFVMSGKYCLYYARNICLTKIYLYTAIFLPTSVLLQLTTFGVLYIKGQCQYSHQNNVSHDRYFFIFFLFFTYLCQSTVVDKHCKLYHLVDNNGTVISSESFLCMFFVWIRNYTELSKISCE